MKTSHTKAKTDRHLALPWSWPLLKESLQSNWLSALVTGIGNALICIVVVMILSTLDLNSTQQSLRQLFGNADMLSLISQGSIALDLSYEGSVFLYRYPGKTLAEEGGPLGDAVTATYDFSESLEENAILRQTVDSLLFDPYYEAYQAASGTESERQEAATAEVLKNVDSLTLWLTALFPDLAPYSNYVPRIIEGQLDAYQEGMEENPALYPDGFDHAATSRRGFVLFLEGVLRDEFGLSDEKSRAVAQIYEDGYLLYKQNGLSGFDLTIHFIVEAIPILVDSDASSLWQGFAMAVQEGRNADTTGFDENRVIPSLGYGYRDEVLLQATKDLVLDFVDLFGYWAFLPDFEVDYLTDSLGRPYTIENGEKVVLSGYEPERMIPVAEGMGKTSNLLEKMHKKELTGSDYTEEEIATAKSEAKTRLSFFVEDLSAFLGEYAQRLYQGEDPYYVENANPLLPGELLSEAIQEKAVSSIQALGEEEILKVFNVQSLSEITEANQGISGESLMTLVVNESLGAIAAFDYYLERSDASLGLVDRYLQSLVLASQGILDSLPVHVEESFEELGSMNLYGILVGIIFFSLAGLLLPMVFTILTSTELLASKVESGSLAFTLSTPIRRSRVVFTQMLFLLLCQVFLTLLLLLGALASRGIGIAMGGEDFRLSLPVDMLFKFVLGNFCVMLAVSGICFLSSAVFNKAKMAIAVGGGITIFFLVTAILGLFGGPAMPSTIRIDSMDFFNYLSIISFYDAESAITGSDEYWYKLLGLLAIAVATYVSSFLVFDRKDLPI